MKQSIKIVLAIFFASLVLFGCEDMLEVDSPRVAYVEDHQLDSPLDSVYSMVGLFALLNDLGDQYVLLGELRADLMTTTDDAIVDLLEIENNTISKDNRYVNTKLYYDIINNCNYFIQNVDTSIFVGGEKAMYKEFAAAKAIRAWTYMQLALNYRSVYYYEQPILKLDDTLQAIQKMELQELMPVLIEDLLPWTEIAEPHYSVEPFGAAIGGYNSDHLFIPISLVLGDLYLWSKNYEQAAIQYKKVIDRRKLDIGKYYNSIRGITNNEFNGKVELNWHTSYQYTFEAVSYLSTSFLYGDGSNMINMTWPNDFSSPMVVASDVAVGNWRNTYYYNDSLTFVKGDLRGNSASYINIYESDFESQPDINNMIDKSVMADENYIAKYHFRSAASFERIILAKASYVYLKYAEAMNLAGRPHFAMAVLNHGLRSANVSDTTIVPRNERIIPWPDYMNFTSTYFNNNVGIHRRGSGGYTLDGNGTIMLSKIPQFGIPAGLDSVAAISYVNDKILEEMALETAFEGNRFHDLMRFALRTDNPGAFMSEKVSKKNATAGARLSNVDNWYLPE
ncbi:MAG: RagB/SusD family nutrient uptake outer membrane protein [Marinilabiliaceae bacterium]|nr:RagB/SusD family nutrient uptake outer membrane protein [Marinilabiliaceae bacterium]